MKKYWLLLLGILALSLSLLHAQDTSDRSVVRLDPAMDALIAADAKLELLFDGGPDVSFEGPTWVHNKKSGFFIFGNVPGNAINKWTPNGGVSVFLDHIFAGNMSEAHHGGRPGIMMLGANGISLDRQGRVVYTV